MVRRLFQSFPHLCTFSSLRQVHSMSGNVRGACDGALRDAHERQHDISAAFAARVAEQRSTGHNRSSAAAAQQRMQVSPSSLPLYKRSPSFASTFTVILLRSPIASSRFIGAHDAPFESSHALYTTHVHCLTSFSTSRLSTPTSHPTHSVCTCEQLSSDSKHTQGHPLLCCACYRTRSNRCELMF